MCSEWNEVLAVNRRGEKLMAHAAKPDLKSNTEIIREDCFLTMEQKVKREDRLKPPPFTSWSPQGV